MSKNTEYELVSNEPNLPSTTSRNLILDNKPPNIDDKYTLNPEKFQFGNCP